MPKRESPLAKSALFQPIEASQPPPPLPTLPPTESQSQAPVATSQQQTSPALSYRQIPVELPPQEQVPLLYTSAPSAEWIARPFDRQYDKQAMNANPYLIGAVEALGKLLRKTKTEMYEEMMAEYVKRHEGMLQQNADVVRHFEKKYREKHSL